MVLNSENPLNASQLKIGGRYSLTWMFTKSIYIFKVTEIDDTYVSFVYSSGETGACLLSDSASCFYEFPLSSLEKELL